MKKLICCGLLSAMVISLVSFKNNTTNKIGRVSQKDTLLYEGEKHFANMQQLTFGGDNAEAYFSFDGKWIIFQRTNAKAGILCDQIWVGKVPMPGQKFVRLA
jgi:hypothetical protein